MRIAFSAVARDVSEDVSLRTIVNRLRTAYTSAQELEAVGQAPAEGGDSEQDHGTDTLKFDMCAQQVLMNTHRELGFRAAVRFFRLVQEVRGGMLRTQPTLPGKWWASN